MSIIYSTDTITTTGTTNGSSISAPSTVTSFPAGYFKIGEVQATTITSEGLTIPEYHLFPQIIDINVYGNDKPKVVEVEFKYGYDNLKKKAICCDEDEFDLKKGIYIAMSKLLYGDTYTTEGVEEKAHELSLRKENEKMVDKAIKDYYKKLKAKEEVEKKAEEERLSKLRRKEKNRARRQRRKERSLNDLAELIKKATK